MSIFISVLSIPDRGAPLGQRAAAPTVTTLTSLTGLQRPSSARCPGARNGLRFYQTAANQWRAQMDARPYRVGSAADSPSCAYVRWAAELWRERAREAKAAFRSWFTRTYAKWRCIHEHEGAWNDTGAPHWGGLQMDMDFQRTYGSEFMARWGTADGWPVWAQLLAAERAYHGYAGYGGRGFHPWPNTARACGLL